LLVLPLTIKGNRFIIRITHRGRKRFWQGGFGMNTLLTDEFQFLVGELLVSNKSILDILTKFQKTNANINRSVVKAVTSCGCIKVNATKQTPQYLGDHETTSTHCEGEICENCRHEIEKNIGENLFYLASLCNLLNISIYDAILNEMRRLESLGKYCLR